MKSYIYLLLLIFILSSCKRHEDYVNASEILKVMNDMDVAKQKSDEEMKYRLLAFMSLEVMFPDGKTRALAAAAASGDERSIERMIPRLSE